MATVRTGRFPARPLRPDWEGSDGETSGDEVSAESSGEIFSSYVLDLLYKGRISAKDACLLCYWAHLSGAPDRVGKLGFPPNKASGAYQRHLDCVLQTKMHKEWYTVQVPSHNKHDQSRSLRQTPVLLPYDEVIQEVSTSPAFATDLGAKASSGELPDAFYDHPNRNGHVDGVMDVPIGLFVDAVPTVKRDSCIGFFIFNIITNQVSDSGAAQTMSVPLRLPGLVQLFCYMGLPQMGPDGLRRGSLPSAETRWHGVGAWTGRRPSWATDAMPWADNPAQGGLG